MTLYINIKKVYRIWGAILALEAIDKDVLKARSEDVQLVKHGHWMCEFYNDVFGVYQADCSVCKKESTEKFDKVSESYEYCPHCGTKMDGAVE